MKRALDTNVLPEKQKPHIQAEQVGNNRPKLGRGRAGVSIKNLNLLLTNCNCE